MWVDFREDFRQTDDEFMIYDESSAKEFDNGTLVVPTAIDLRTRSKIGEDVK